MSPSDTEASRPPVLVLGAGVTALGVLRSLARGGEKAFVGSPAGDIVSRSRWYRPPPGARALEANEPLGEYLSTVSLERAILVPCSDELVLAAAELEPELETRFTSFLPTGTVLRTLVDKGAFRRLLDEVGVPYPATYLVESAADVERIDDAVLESAFIKPRSSQAFFREFGVKAFRADGRARFHELVDWLMGAGFDLMIQEYVPGPPSNHYFVDGFASDGGRIVATLVRRRLEMNPPDFGNSTLMRTVPADEAAGALDSLERLLASVSYRGVFSAEFKQDERDGTFRIVEINARPWWYVDFAARAGLDVVAMTVTSALGEELAEHPGYEVGRKLVYPYHHYLACRRNAPGRFAAFGRFVGDWMGADQPVFAWDDPWPSIWETTGWGWGFVGRRLGRGR